MVISNLIKNILIANDFLQCVCSHSLFCSCQVVQKIQHSIIFLLYAKWL